MDNIERDLGELTGKVNSFIEWDKSVHESVKEELRVYKELAERNHQEVLTALQTVKSELSIYKTVYKTIKFLLGAVVLVLTLKFGDVKLLWASIFG